MNPLLALAMNEGALFPRFARECTRQGQRGDQPSGPMRLVRVVSYVFLDYANDLNGGYFAGNADHPVLLWNT
jgi:hypothetical protein